MAPRSQPHRIEGDFSPEMASNIDDMFQILFDDVRNDTMFPTTTEGDMMYRDDTKVVRLPIGDANTVLRTDGEIPEWGKVNLAASGDTTGTLPVPSGGTGAATLTGIVKGTGVSALSAIALPADATKFLDGTGAFSTPATGAVDVTALPEVYTGPSGSSATGGVGNVTVSAIGTNAIVNDTAGQWDSATSTANGTPSGVRTTAGLGFAADAAYTFVTKIRTGANLADIRIWIGFTSAAFTNVDTHAGDTIAIRYSSVAGDGGGTPGWVGVTRSVATGAQSVTAAIANINTSTAYTLKIVCTSTLITFSVGGASQTLAANIPTGVDMQMSNIVIRVATANKVLEWKYLKAIRQ